MARWKLFGRSKEKKQGNEKEIDILMFEDKKPKKQNEELVLETVEETEEPAITEYQETLYSSEHPSKKHKEAWKRSNWESASTIEKNVDTIDKKKTDYKQTTVGPDDLEKKVDKLFSNKMIKTVEKKKVIKNTTPEGYIIKINKKTGLEYYQKE